MPKHTPRPLSEPARDRADAALRLAVNPALSDERWLELIRSAPPEPVYGYSGSGD